eukprot:366268-Chlamydomonas_euryale.AAC.10
MSCGFQGFEGFATPGCSVGSHPWMSQPANSYMLKALVVYSNLVEHAASRVNCAEFCNPPKSGACQGAPFDRRMSFERRALLGLGKLTCLMCWTLSVQPLPRGESAALPGVWGADGPGRGRVADGSRFRRRSRDESSDAGLGSLAGGSRPSGDPSRMRTPPDPSATGAGPGRAALPGLLGLVSVAILAN